MAYGDGQNRSVRLAAAGAAVLIVCGTAYALNAASQISPSPPEGPQWITANGTAEGGITTVEYTGPIDAPTEGDLTIWEPAPYDTDPAPSGYEYHARMSDDIPMGTVSITDSTGNGKLKILRFRQLPTRNLIATAYVSEGNLVVELPEGSYAVQIAQGYGYDSRMRMPTTDITISEGRPIRVPAESVSSIDLSSFEGEPTRLLEEKDFAE